VTLSQVEMDRPLSCWRRALRLFIQARLGGQQDKSQKVLACKGPPSHSLIDSNGKQRPSTLGKKREGTLCAVTVKVLDWLSSKVERMGRK
jgi:hypothetical protein